MAPRLVLVTGGAGFIGSNLVNALIDSGLRVRIVDNFATSLSIEQPVETHTVNVIGTLNVLIAGTRGMIHR